MYSLRLFVQNSKKFFLNQIYVNKILNTNLKHLFLFNTIIYIFGLVNLKNLNHNLSENKFVSKRLDMHMHLHSL